MVINPNWENYRKRHAIRIEDAPERLTSNWLGVAELPDTIRYFQPTGAIDHSRRCTADQDVCLPIPPTARGMNRKERASYEQQA